MNFVTVQTNACGGEFYNEIEIKNLQTITTSQNVLHDSVVAEDTSSGEKLDFR